MLRWIAIAAISAGGCGRVGFDAIARGDGGGTTGDGGSSHLVAYYAMEDDPTPGAIADSSGNHRNGTCSSCPSLDTGKRGNGYKFDGVMDHFSVVDDGAFALTTGFTFAFWIQPTNTSGTYTALSKPLATGLGASMEFALFLTLSTFCTTGSVESCDPIAAINTGTWTHVALTWDGTTKRAYFNAGQIVALPATSVFDSTAFVVGGDVEDGMFDNPYEGYLDELRIYDVALAPADITALAAP